jgi:hypothetical protein
MLNDRRPGDPIPAGDADGEGVASPDDAAATDSPGELLGLVMVVPNGVGPGVTEVPGTGVAVGGTPVGRGVGLGVGRGVGLGVGGGGTGLGTGVGPATRTATEVEDGFVPRLPTALKVTVQEPGGKVVDPFHIPLRVEPESNDSDVVRVVDPFDASALTLIAVSPVVVLPT